MFLGFGLVPGAVGRGWCLESRRRKGGKGGLGIGREEVLRGGGLHHRLWMAFGLAAG